jgi:hypothetical protein
LRTRRKRLQTAENREQGRERLDEERQHVVMIGSSAVDLKKAPDSRRARLIRSGIDMPSERSNQVGTLTIFCR